MFWNIQNKIIVKKENKNLKKKKKPFSTHLVFFSQWQTEVQIVNFHLDCPLQAGKALPITNPPYLFET